MAPNDMRYLPTASISTSERRNGRTPLVAAILLALVALAASAPRASAQSSEPRAARCLTGEYLSYLAHRHDSGAAASPFAYSALSTRPGNLPLTFVSKTGHFKVHYTKTGDDAPSLRDIDGNGVPDYIDSVAFYFDEAWNKEINDYGYAAPPQEPIDGPEIDIYVYDLPETLYGGAVPEDDNRVDDNRVLGYLIIDDDYSERTYTTKGVDAVKVTSAHELHHIIQFASYRYALSQASIYESTSVWFERQVHPEIPDYRQYVDTLLKTPQFFPYSTNETNNGITGYGHVLFMDYASINAGRDVVREMWDEFKTKDEFPAIDAALRRHNMNLENAWCELARWCYYTGSRAIDTLFPEAASYPTMRSQETPRTLTSSGVLFNGSLAPLAFALHQVILPAQGSNPSDTADFVVTNTRSDIGAGGNVREENYSIEVSTTPQSGFTAMLYRSDTVLYYRLDTPSQQDVHFCLIPLMNGSVFKPAAVKVSPQPFVNDGIDNLVFGVIVPRDQVKTIHLWIYTTSLAPVAEVVQNGLREAYNQYGVLWDGRDGDGRMAPSGVYLYEVEVDGGTRVRGKFAIVRR